MKVTILLLIFFFACWNAQPPSVLGLIQPVTLVDCNKYNLSIDRRIPPSHRYQGPSQRRRVWLKIQMIYWYSHFMRENGRRSNLHRYRLRSGGHRYFQIYGWQIQAFKIQMEQLKAIHHMGEWSTHVDKRELLGWGWIGGDRSLHTQQFTNKFRRSWRM